MLQEDAVEASVVGVVTAEVAVGVAEEVVVPLAAAAQVDAVVPVAEEVLTLSSSPTGTRASSLRREKTTCWSLKILSPATQCTARSGYRSMAASRARRQNTECGILSVRSWPLVCLVVWMIFSSNLAQKCFTSVQPVERVSAMLLISLVL